MCLPRTVLPWSWESHDLSLVLLDGGSTPEGPHPQLGLVWRMLLGTQLSRLWYGVRFLNSVGESEYSLRAGVTEQWAQRVSCD